MTTWINPNDKTQAKYLPHIGDRACLRPLASMPAASITGITQEGASELAEV